MFALFDVVCLDFFGEGFSGLRVDQLVADFRDEGGVTHADNGLLVVRGYFDRGVRLTSGGATDKQGLGEASLSHLIGIGDHFVERGGDQTRETNDVGSPFLSFFEDGIAVDHHA